MSCRPLWRHIWCVDVLLRVAHAQEPISGQIARLPGNYWLASVRTRQAASCQVKTCSTDSRTSFSCRPLVPQEKKLETKPAVADGLAAHRQSAWTGGSKSARFTIPIQSPEE